MSRKWSSAVIWVAIGGVCLLLFCPCLRTVRDEEGWLRSTVNIKWVGLGLHSYHEANGHLPPAVVRDKEGRPLYSWRVLILPYIEQGHLYEQFNLNEPWDSEHNKALIDRMPKTYAPALGGRDEPGLTRYQVLVGPGTAFERPGLTWADFPDGLGNTILVVEAEEPVPWSKPQDLEYDPAGPLPPLGGVFTRPVHFLCREVGRNPGFAACFADGSARFIRCSADEHLIRGHHHPKRRRTGERSRFGVEGVEGEPAKSPNRALRARRRHFRGR